LLEDPRGRDDTAYYVQSANRRLHALVHRNHKLVFSVKTGTFARYDLARDPRERRNLFRETSALDRDLVGRMVRKNPAIARAEPDDAETSARLAARLDGATGASLDAEVEFLARAVALASDARVRAAAERLFLRATSVDARIEVGRSLGAVDPARWVQLLGSYLRSLDDPAALEEVVAGLARRGQGPVAVRWVQRRLRQLARQPYERWEPWLRPVLPWPKERERGWRAAFEPLLRAREDGPSVGVVALLLDNVASLGRSGRALASDVRARVEHPDPVVSTGACRALGRIGGPDDAALLRRVAAGGRRLDPRVRQAIMHAIARLEGTAALDVVLALARDPLLTVDAVQVLGQLKSPRGLPYLERIAQRHYNAVTRAEARKAIARVKQR
jgi:hypothetical protein